MSIPLVSVILRTKNRPDFLRESLNSAIEQTMTEREVLVINDGGEDVSEIIRHLDIVGAVRYFHEKESIGRCAAANLGLREARGKYISYLDDDDLYYPDHLEGVVGALEEGDYQVAYSDAYCASQRLDPRTGKYEVYDRRILLSHDFDPVRLFSECFIHLSTFMHEKACTDRLGGFDEELSVLEDLDLFFRLSQDYPFLHVKKVSAEYRLREGAPGLASEDEAKGTMEAELAARSGKSLPQEKGQVETDARNAIALYREEFARTREVLFRKYQHIVLPTLVQRIREQGDELIRLGQRCEALEKQIGESTTKPRRKGLFR
jgi:glycosyltransferase involved in cell wall biosynthesis